MSTSPSAVQEAPSSEAAKSLRIRRSFLAAGGTALAGAGAFAMAGQAAAQGGNGTQESLLDVWVKTGKARIGVDLNNKPLRFRDTAGKPTGLGIEFLELLMKDIGATPEYIEMPFGQTFAALAAGKFDMIGTFVTILPSRGLRGTFAGFPAYYQQNVAYLKPGSRVKTLAELNRKDVKIACQQGSSEETTLRSVFPLAAIQTFPQVADAASSVGGGLVDALITDAFFVTTMSKTFPEVKVLGESVNAIPNTFFMPHNDFKLWAYVTNWLRYQGSLRTIVGLQNKWFGTEARDKYGIPGIGVGSGGEPLVIKG
ncbi:Cyclohexadienyl dehydratase precursor (plasmid) [Variovorax sp. SRS16]|uniref:substrate-binding periplasmic protein n=1 Tax=Variovorax sp. SRS16 TaxID=282217 RepID=UPI00131905CE|nr:ABC transporter substrate-binding protein [Variovorax sp. SRS16]VTU46411.1 Cyclohexadienyl dehydratase precursor [Variovorax sp. SRS16]